jgi:hypothetical protein
VKGEVRQINGKRVATPEYRSWQMMKNRCLNSNAEDWEYYGGRGITVCKRWLVYDNFLEDMGRRPTLKHTLERKRTGKGYSRANCYWATRETQARNRPYVYLSIEKAREIRTLYATGKYFQAELATLYNSSQAYISQILRNMVWKELGGAQ